MSVKARQHERLLVQANVATRRRPRGAGELAGYTLGREFTVDGAVISLSAFPARRAQRRLEFGTVRSKEEAAYMRALLS